MAAPIVTAPEDPLADNQIHSPSAVADDAAAFADPDDDDDDDDDDAELLAYVRKLDAGARPRPRLTTASPNNDNVDGDGDGDGNGSDNELDRSSSEEEIFPSPGTRAVAEKRRLTQAAKVAPYVPPRGTRAASIIEKERAAREALVRRR